MPTFPTVETSLADRAHAAIGDAILRCEYAPGTKLKLETLAAASGLSSSPLREALNRLVQEGLVLALENRGFWVAPISVAELKDLTRMRLLVESEVLASAIDCGDDEWEARVVAAFHRLDLTEQRLRQDADSPARADWSALHKAFHLALFSGSDSPRLIRTASSLFSQAERYRNFATAHRRKPRNVRGEHASLMRACLDRKPKEALRLLREHIAATAESVAGVLADVKRVA